MATITVRPTGFFPLDRDRIQGAINKANPGDTVFLKCTNILGQYTPFNCGSDTPIDYLTYGLHYTSDSTTFANRSLIDPNSNPLGGAILRNRPDQWVSRVIYVNKDITLRGEFFDNDDGDYDPTEDRRDKDDWTNPRTILDGAWLLVAAGESHLDWEDNTKWGKPAVHLKKLEFKHSLYTAIQVFDGTEFSMSSCIVQDAIQGPNQFGEIAANLPGNLAAKTSSQAASVHLGHPVFHQSPGTYNFLDGDMEEVPSFNVAGSNITDGPGPCNVVINRCKLITPHHKDPITGEVYLQSHTRTITIGYYFLEGANLIKDNYIQGLISVGTSHVRSCPSGTTLKLLNNEVRMYHSNDSTNQTLLFESSDRSKGTFFERPYGHSGPAPLYDRYFETNLGPINVEVQVSNNLFQAANPVGNTAIVQALGWNSDEATGPRHTFSKNIVISGPTDDNPLALPVVRGVDFQSAAGFFEGTPVTNWDITDNIFKGKFSSRALNFGISGSPFGGGTTRLANCTMSLNQVSEVVLPPSAGDYFFFGTITDTVIETFEGKGQRPPVINYTASFNRVNTTVTASGYNFV